MERETDRDGGSWNYTNQVKYTTNFGFLINLQEIFLDKKPTYYN